MELIDVSRDWSFFFLSTVILCVAVLLAYSVYKDRDRVANKIGTIMLILCGVMTAFFICDFFLTDRHYIYTYKVYDWNMVMKGDFIIESQTKDIVKLKMKN